MAEKTGPQVAAMGSVEVTNPGAVEATATDLAGAIDPLVAVTDLVVEVVVAAGPGAVAVVVAGPGAVAVEAVAGLAAVVSFTTHYFWRVA